jgi:uncharacterized protein YprB with RNaseH-like and TPR domain
MLTATFLHAPGIGQQTERRFWERGIRSWDEALAAAPRDLPVTRPKYTTLIPALEASQNALADRDFRFFAQNLPNKEHWRAFDHFSDRIGFLDIETTGGYQPDDVTLIGVYDGYESRFYIKGKNLEDFVQEAERCAAWVTYFGTGFDVPFLRRRFPNLAWDQLHIDLCPLLRRLGYTGGLKHVEERVGINRPPEITGMSGFDAVHLWNQYRRYRSEEALTRLIQYNRADIENLNLLFQFAYPRLKAHSGFESDASIR